MKTGPVKLSDVAKRDLDLPILLCPKCGYDLRGLSASRCPECGHEYEVTNIRPTASVAAVRWLHDTRGLARLRAVWRISWSPRRGLYSYGYRPAFGGDASQVFWAVLSLHAIVYVIVACAYLIIGFSLDLLTRGFAGWVQGTAWHGGIQLLRIAIYGFLAIAIAWTWAAIRRESRSGMEILSLAAIVYSWSVAAEVLTQPLLLVYHPLLLLDRLPDVLSRSWLSHVTQLILTYARYGIFGLFVFSGLRVLTDKKWVLPILIPLPAVLVAKLIDEHAVRAAWYIMRGGKG